MKGKQSNRRKLRAISLLAQNKVNKISDSTFRVWSQNGDHHYIVLREGLKWKCECPDFQFNHIVSPYVDETNLQKLEDELDTRWGPLNPIDGRYMWLPIEFTDKGIAIRNLRQWDLSLFE